LKDQEALKQQRENNYLLNDIFQENLFIRNK